MTSTPSSRPTPHSLSPDAAEVLAREAEMGYTNDGDSVGKMLINTLDAEVWARAFRQQFGDVMPDEGTMLTWFANALETGRSFGRKELCPHADPIQLADDLYCCRDCGLVIEPVKLEDKFVEGFQEGRA
jgi:hypothetical protein